MDETLRLSTGPGIAELLPWIEQVRAGGLPEVGEVGAPAPPGDYPRPRSKGWRVVRPFGGIGTDIAVGAMFERRGIVVISTRVVAEYPDGIGEGEQDHVSVSVRGHRPSASQLQLALAAFGMVGTEEDNHHPGIARHFWRPVDPAHRATCQCKETETVVRDGAYEWTNPTDGECRGCYYQRLSGRPCPIHGPPAR